jgi:hypothetical protein
VRTPYPPTTPPPPPILYPPSHLTTSFEGEGVRS